MHQIARIKRLEGRIQTIEIAALASLSEWQDSIFDRDLTTSPASPTAGDRYIMAGTGGDWSGGTTNDIVEFVTGTTWRFTSPTLGMVVGVDDEVVNVRYDGAAWVVQAGGGASVFGEDYQSTERNDAVASSTPTFITYLTLTTPSLAVGTYIWLLTSHVITSAPVTEFSIQAAVDGTPPAIPDIRTENSVSNGTTEHNKHGQLVVTVPGIHTVEVQFAQSAGGGTVTMRHAYIALWRVL